MKHIELYENFLSESKDGYGRDYFIMKKEGKVFKYFFKIKGEDDDLCFIANIGKFSRKISIESAENSYAVLSIEPIEESIMDDYLVNETGYKSKKDSRFKLNNSEFIRFYNIIGKAIQDYLEKNGKVSTIYDETLMNLDFEYDEYLDIINEVIDSWGYERWGVQEGPSSDVIIYSKRDHE